MMPTDPERRFFADLRGRLQRSTPAPLDPPPPGQPPPSAAQSSERLDRQAARRSAPRGPRLEAVAFKSLPVPGACLAIGPKGEAWLEVQPDAVEPEGVAAELLAKLRQAAGLLVVEDLALRVPRGAP